MLPKVLVVEDEKYWQEKWRKKLSDKVVIISAFSVDDAEKEFATNNDIAIIVMDGHIPIKPFYEFVDTFSLVKILRRTFKGPMIACSNTLNDQLMYAGCNNQSEKENLPEKVLEILETLDLQNFRGNDTVVMGRFTEDMGP